MPKAAKPVATTLVNIAIDVPIRQAFTYRASDRLPAIGARVKVSFGRRKVLGVVVAYPRKAPTGFKLKAVGEVLDEPALFSETSIAMVQWLAQYYHHPIGEVWHAVLPTVLRNGMDKTHGLQAQYLRVKAPSGTGKSSLKNAPVQRAVMAQIDAAESPVLITELLAEIPNAKPAIRALIEKEFLTPFSEIPSPEIRPASEKSNTLSDAQKAAVKQVSAQLDSFACHVLDGVTGSGKTEVYFGLIDKVLAKQQQALVMLPEIALTDQHRQRFERRFGSRVAQIHSGMSAAARYRVWWQVRSGEIDVVLATRSGIFLEFKALGLIIVDEEHDLSYKQQEGLRYHARSVAVKRAQLGNIPVLLGSATPSFETLHNIEQGRYQHLVLPSRIKGSDLPDITLVNLNSRPEEGGLSDAVVQTLKQTLEKKKQALVFINRRGYSPVMYCASCQVTMQCKRCDANMTSHRVSLQCHHCGAKRAAPKVCEACGEASLLNLGEGTQKIAERLGELFPAARIQRFDRDELGSARKLQSAMAKVHAQEIDILVGTQLISKGHDFSAVQLVVVVNADQGLHSIDFRAPEQLVQQLIQVAGRAGRGQEKGQVLIQTNLISHPAIQAVAAHRYADFAEAELAQRKLAQFPPYTHIALWRARSQDAAEVMQFLQTVAQQGRQIQAEGGVCFDAVQSPMFKRGGQYHAQLLVSASRRQVLHQWLAVWIPRVESFKDRGIKWSIDIDPVSLF